MIAAFVFVLCALTSVACALLLIRGCLASRTESMLPFLQGATAMGCLAVVGCFLRFYRRSGELARPTREGRRGLSGPPADSSDMPVRTCRRRSRHCATTSTSVSTARSTRGAAARSHASSSATPGSQAARAASPSKST